MRSCAPSPRQVAAAAVVALLFAVAHVGALTIVDVPLGQRLQFESHSGLDLRVFRLPTRSLPYFFSRANLTITIANNVPTYYTISFLYPSTSNTQLFLNNTAIELTFQNDPTNPTEYFLYLGFSSSPYTGSGSIDFSVAPITASVVPNIAFNKVYVFNNVTLFRDRVNVPVARHDPRFAENMAYGFVLNPSSYSYTFGAYLNFAPTLFAQGVQVGPFISQPNYLAFRAESDPNPTNVTVAVVVTNDTKTLLTPFSEQLTVTAFKPFLVAIKWLDLPQSVDQGRNTSITFTLGAAGTFEVGHGGFKWPDYATARRETLLSSGTVAIPACSISRFNSTFLSVIWIPPNYELSQIADESLKTTVTIQSSSTTLVTQPLAPSTQLFSSSSLIFAELTGIITAPSTIRFTFSGQMTSVSAGPIRSFGAGSTCTQPAVYDFFAGGNIPACRLFSATNSPAIESKVLAAIPRSSSLSYSINPSIDLPIDGSAFRISPSSNVYLTIPAGATYPLTILVTPVSVPVLSASIDVVFYQSDCTSLFLAAPRCSFSQGATLPCRIFLSCPSQAIYVAASALTTTYEFQVLRNGSSQAISATSANPLTIDLALNSTLHLDITVPPSSSYDLLVSSTADIREEPLFLPGGCQATNSFSQVARGFGVSDETSVPDPTKTRFTLSQSGSLVLRATSAAMSYTVTFTPADSAPSPPVRCQSVSAVSLPEKCTGRVPSTDLIDLSYDRAQESSSIDEDDSEIVAVNPALASDGSCRDYYLTLLCRSKLPLCVNTFLPFTPYPAPCLQTCIATAASRGCTGYAAYQICRPLAFGTCNLPSDALAPTTLAPEGQSQVPAPSPQPGSSTPTSASSPTTPGSNSPSQAAGQPTLSAPSQAQINASSVFSVSAAAIMSMISLVLMVL